MQRRIFKRPKTQAEALSQRRRLEQSTDSPSRSLPPNVRVLAAGLLTASKVKKLEARQRETAVREREVTPTHFSTSDTVQARRKNILASGNESNPTPTPPPVAVSEALPVSKRPAKRSRKWMAIAGVAAFAALGLGDARKLHEVRAQAATALNQIWEAAKLESSSVHHAPTPPSLADASLLKAFLPAEETAPEPIKINREGHVSIPGGILVFPSTFNTTDGTYDLLIHFHGNTSVVKESTEVAKLNAPVAIINLGVGSAPYQEYYAVPGTYEELLADVDHGLHQRGIPTPHLRRVALSSWSAGYGALSTILQVRKKTEDLDALLVLDGIHCGWEQGALNHRQLKPFLDAAQDAADGRIYFGITHSSIDPVTYASSTATADYLIDGVGAKSNPLDPVHDAPRYVDLESMAMAVSKDKAKTMEPIREARKGSFHVIGYKGETPEHHMAHLFEMSQTLLAELAARWE